jgi:hypothetical protein
MSNPTPHNSKLPFAALFLTALLPQAHVSGVTVNAKTSDSFVDSIGVNTHWAQAFSWKAFAGEWTAGLAELGIRHMRTTAITGGQIAGGESQRISDPNARTRIRNACAAVAGGAKMNIIVGQYWGNGPAPGHNLNTFPISEELDAINTLGLDVVESISGPNEWDNNHEGISPKSAHTTDLRWADHLATYTQNLRSAIVGRGWTQEILSADVLRDDSHAALAARGIAAHYDTQNIHIYPVGNNRYPEDPATAINSWTSASHLNRINAQTNNGYNTKPRVITEHGWIAQQTWNGDGQSNENSKAKYLIRGSLYYFSQGFKRSYIYCLGEQASTERNIALMSTDWSGSTPVTIKTKAFHTVRDTLALLRDQGNTANFTPSSLTYTLGSSPNVNSLVLQKRDGRFYLVLWRGMNSYDYATNTEVAVAPVNTTLTFPSSMPLVRQFRPYSNGQSVVTQASNVTSVSVSIPDHPLIIEITPPQIIADGTYKVISRHSSKAVSIAGPYMTNGTNIHQWAYYNNLLEQRWTFTHLGNNVYRIVTPYSGQAMAVDNGFTSNGANVVQWPYYNAPHFKWQVTRGPAGYFYISPTHSLDKTLSVAGPSIADGANIHQWQWFGTNSQQWQIAAP